MEGATLTFPSFLGMNENNPFTDEVRVVNKGFESQGFKLVSLVLANSYRAGF